MEKQQLTGEYILDLFSVAFKKQDFFEILIKHLKYSYLTLEPEKKFWKKSIQLYRIRQKPPSIGLVQVELRKDDDVQDLIYEIKERDVKDYISVIDAFQNFIKESMFVEVFEKAGELYNKGQEHKAFEIFTQGADEIHHFSIRNKMFKKVFGDFEDRDTARLSDETPRQKVPFFIDKLDEYSFGGPETGETVLVTAESGVGKSQFLIHYAVQTARVGGKVALFQIEGTERQVMDRLDAAWTGSLYHDVKRGDIDRSLYKKLQRVLKRIKGEIFVEAFEKFGGVTITDIRNSVRELKKIHGDELKLVCIDYLELMDTDDGINYGPNAERHRQQKLGRFCKELAMEQNVVVATVTQASNLASELKKDPAFVMTREYLSEDKGKIRPFDFHYTLNQTYDEMKAKHAFSEELAPRMRIFADKLREYASGQVTTIITNLKRARFYDRKATIDTIIDFEEDE